MKFSSRLRSSLAVILMTTVVAISGLAPVGAVSGGDFHSDRIADDSIFFNTGTLSTSDIQNFLNSKVPTCDTNHAGSGSNQPPFTCLKSYMQAIPGKSADAYCAGSVGGGTKSSAQIISDVANACQINPEVLIVLLQKEQSLVTDTWPWTSQYDEATGYGCPDSSPSCDADYAGFFNQLWNAAHQFQRYVKQAGSFNYAVGRNSYVQYNPNAGCGGTNLTMQTSATAALYNYTPYQPNAAALNNLYGTGDGCSAYGNRNFWRLFNDWFGPTTNDSNNNVLTFIRLNHSSGNVETVGYTSLSDYSYMARYNLAGYPAVPGDGNVVPAFWPPNGDLAFIRLNHSSGNVEVVSYNAASGFKNIDNYTLAGYPAVPGDGNVVPEFWPNGDLTFIRLNHSSGNVEVVSYSSSSNFKKIANYSLTGYPSVPGDGNVVPLYWPPNGDLSFIRLNHSSGNVEVVTYSASSNFKKIINYSLTGYPAVPGDGNVIPLYQPDGDLSFIRLNYGGGNAQIATYSWQSNFKQLIDLRTTAYPAVPGDGNVIPL
ncbi:MAG TPA: hypothetical protein VN554_01705, partial [Verrucomicrobiae bacterium]|nr:hypothetical protein [Verrucomicrobiae bacterium]